MIAFCGQTAVLDSPWWWWECVLWWFGYKNNLSLHMTLKTALWSIWRLPRLQQLHNTGLRLRCGEKMAKNGVRRRKKSASEASRAVGWGDSKGQRTFRHPFSSADYQPARSLADFFFLRLLPSVGCYLLPMVLGEGTFLPMAWLRLAPITS